MDEVSPQELAAVDQVMAGVRDVMIIIEKLTAQLHEVGQQADDLLRGIHEREQRKFIAIAARYDTGPDI